MRNPLLDTDFLKDLDNQTEHEVYAKIIALTFDEDPTEEITGKVTQGSVNVDGTSAVRRSCSLSMIAKDVNISDFYWGLNTKFKLQVGLKNNINPDYEDIIWFNQGTFLITSFSTALSTSGYTISISGKDKMCLLNGDIGGSIDSLSVDFGTYDEIDADGNTVTYDYPIKEIILEAVHQYAGEPYHNIVIEDLDDQGFELMEYRGDVDLYMLIDQDSGEVTNIRFNDGTAPEYYVYDTEKYYKIDSSLTFTSGREYFSRYVDSVDSDNNPIYGYTTELLTFSTYEPNLYYIYDESVNRYTTNTIKLNSSSFEYDSRITALDFETDQTPTHIWVENKDVKNIYTVARIQYGDTCGYRLTELTYAGDLVGSVGSSITSILDKIVSMLGNYEYFYDTDGIFHFRRKKTYVNNSWNNLVTNRDEAYADSAAYTSSSVYSFTDNTLVSAFNNAPALNNLRNDFAIWGKKSTSKDSTEAIHLRYAIDKKPCYYKNYAGKIYLTEEEYNRILSEEEDTSELTNTVVSTGESRFHVTAIPSGLSQKWWEIDDWARRYMYYADKDNENSIDYYLSLTSKELCDLVAGATKPTAEEVVEKSFNYYLYQLQILTLGNFGKTWQTEDWLTVLPCPSGVSLTGYQNYYTRPDRYGLYKIINENQQKYWCWLFDTALYDGVEYIKSIEHGNAYTDSADIYPTSKTGCSHTFKYALERKKQGASYTYHSYIYDPQIPDNVKNDSSFIEKSGTDDNIVSIQNYEITDWREIIFQMQKDYYKYQHDEDFLATVAANNSNYYPIGVTGYEQYYIDIQGFWRQLYDPTVEPIDLKTFKPEDSHNYYVWDDDTESFTSYTFRQATSILPLESGKDYFYYKGTKTLDNLIAIEQAKKDAISAASSAMSKEVKSLNKDDYSSESVYQQAIANITKKYTDIISENELSLAESAGSYTKSDFLKVKTVTTNSDGTSTTTYDYNLAAALVAAFYPYYDKISESSWKDYELYSHFDNSQKYYKMQFMKDFTQLSSKVGYYTKGYDSTGNAIYSTWTAKATIKDTTAEPDELGIYPDKEVPSFQIGKVYYTYEGYEKVSSLQVGESGNIYYTYGSYKKPTTYLDSLENTYYERTLGNYIEGNYTYIFTPTTTAVNKTNYANYYVNVPNPNAADKSIVKGYTKILQLDPSEKYYALTEGTDGSVIESTPTYFTRGKSYYTKDAEGKYVFAFTFEKGVVYYIYNGYKEAIDLTIDDTKSDCLSTGSFYYLYGEDDDTIINTDDTNAYFTLGKIYYGYKKVDNDTLTNGKYYVSHDNNKTFVEEYILRSFARGSTYYIYEEDYDLIDPYSDFDSNTTYFVYIPNTTLNDGSYYYCSIDDLIKNTTTLDDDETFKVACNELISNYGIFVDENKKVYRLGQAYDFYIKQTRYREVNYYNFAFYKAAEKWFSGVQYYKLVGTEYQEASPTTQDELDNETYYTLLDGYKRAEKFIDGLTYYTRSASGYTKETSTVTERTFNNKAYFIEDDFKVYLTDEFNVKTHWTMNLEYPEMLLFWFDFLDISDGTLAQYAVQEIGDRPKSVNDDNVKAIYYRDTPTVIFCGSDGVYIKTFIDKQSFAANPNYYYEKDSQGNYSLATTYSASKDYYRRMTAEDKQPGYTYINLTDTIDNLFSISSQGKTAFDMLDNYLYNYSYCTESITMTTIPIYYLEPNCRVFVHDDNSGIDGEYIVTKLTVPLQYNGTMSITATKAVDRIL